MVMESQGGAELRAVATEAEHVVGLAVAKGVVATGMVALVATGEVAGSTLCNHHNLAHRC